MIDIVEGDVSKAAAWHETYPSDYVAVLSGSGLEAIIGAQARPGIQMINPDFTWMAPSDLGQYLK